MFLSVMSVMVQIRSPHIFTPIGICLWWRFFSLAHRIAEKSGDELWLTPGCCYTHLGKPEPCAWCCRVISRYLSNMSAVWHYIKSAWPQHSLSSSQSGFLAAQLLRLLCPIFHFDHWLRKSLIGNIILAVSVKVALKIGLFSKGR